MFEGLGPCSLNSGAGKKIDKGARAVLAVVAVKGKKSQ